MGASCSSTAAVQQTTPSAARTSTAAAGPAAAAAAASAVPAPHSRSSQNQNAPQSRSERSIGATSRSTSRRSRLSRLFSRGPAPVSSEQERRRARERAEIEALQRELQAMEDLFSQLLGTVFREMQEEAEGSGPPPASAQAIRRLPTIVCQAEDLLDEHNRQCSVCFGDCHVGHKMVRLPCGHLFHGACIGPWLYQRCTCPVCRYELPTDSTDYEEGRIERMRSRRPRLRRHELDRMKIRELKDLAHERLGMSSDSSVLTDKSELINQIIDSGKVDLIASPEPIRVRLTDLRAMGVGALRKKMEQAGVFFDPVDVIEKEDMVQLFVGSGRVSLLEDGSNCAGKELCNDETKIVEEEEADNENDDDNIPDDDDYDEEALRALVKSE